MVLASPHARGDPECHRAAASLDTPSISLGKLDLRHTRLELRERHGRGVF